MTVLEGVTVDPTHNARRQAGGAPLPCPVPAFVTVACRNEACVRYGVQAQIRLTMRALGVFEIPALVCAHCSHPIPLMWPGLEDTMPKNTVHGGPSNNYEPFPDPAPVVAEPVQETVAEPEPDAADAEVPEPEADPGLVAEPVKPAKKTAAPKKAAPKVVTGKGSVVIGDLGAGNG